MPFLAYGSAPTFTPKGFCCLKINDRWKLHHFDNGSWQRINTGLPEDATECSPTADFVNDKWIVTFVAGGYDADRRFYLYKIDDLENSNPQKVVRADVGFVWKNKIVFGGRTGGLKILEGNKITTLTFQNVQYLYRVSYNPSNPQELLISGQDNAGEIFSWICNPVARRLQSLCVNGKPAYKSAFLDNTLYYAERGNTGYFEERHVVETSEYVVSDLDFEAIVKVETENLTKSTGELLQRFTGAMTRWAKKGFKIADAETLSKRKSICSTCEYWDSSAYLGFGKCRKCGCSSAKLKLETEHCPIGKW